ncbi:hypothetical protein J4Q44_G00360790, partial [Coregonus suidteri]
QRSKTSWIGWSVSLCHHRHNGKSCIPNKLPVKLTFFTTSLNANEIPIVLFLSAPVTLLDSSHMWPISIRSYSSCKQFIHSHLNKQQFLMTTHLPTSYNNLKARHWNTFLPVGWF